MKRLIQNLIHNPKFKQKQAIGLLCNQVSFDFISHQYLFELLSNQGTLKRLFIPEHGLFSELQDQEKFEGTSTYHSLGLHGVDIISLYQHQEKSLAPTVEKLKDLDAIVIDIQDVGCRYFTFTSTVYYLLEVLAQNKLSPSLFVLNRSNPAGDSIEGTPIDATYASFIGLEGLPNRHGMSTGELCLYFRNRLQANVEISVITDSWSSSLNPISINPSPNIPNSITPLIYSGQCLFEGTNLSEGRGTTRPFELIGSPDLTWEEVKSFTEKINKHWGEWAILRPLKFIPTFHKFMGEVCQGFQLHLINQHQYHSLLHSLIIVRAIAELKGDLLWRKGKYEFGS
ncbi:Uncharacterized conserved protein UCP016719 [Emticicia oligotrophica DSM 17448]|uniref:Uncharacterized conserved protein UCP016719 n=1 Tax=Emticicia oligotrophica (strain DSM 17448 / CIP 109782 / MTCC 6937 / GPTSA100-15) TaxID=929562 RepID=A0ABN4APB6_EMTOG|nr:DUF1343 domain-containing protein [Emticicia oligotrophica]AFK03048.1 Uncharacterized conserved protein UCP016719 [Emticicia oligotrophica DSM 17448]